MIWLKSVPLGKHGRSLPFWCSLVPRCHNEYGSQKLGGHPILLTELSVQAHLGAVVHRGRAPRVSRELPEELLLRVDTSTGSERGDFGGETRARASLDFGMDALADALDAEHDVSCSVPEHAVFVDRARAVMDRDPV